MAGKEIFAVRKPRHRRTWTVAAIVLVLVFIILGQAGGAVPALMSGFLTESNGDAWPQLTYVLVVMFGLSSLILFAWVWLFERRSLAAIGLNAKGLTRFGRGYGLGLLFLGIVVGVIYALGGYEIEAGGVFAAFTPGLLLPLLALMVGFIIQGSTEELLIRGWLMQLIASRHGIVLAVIGNSALFAVLHGANIPPSQELFAGLLNIVLVGILLSLYAIREGSLWGVCGWHAAWNWLLGVGFGLEVSGQTMDVTPLATDLASTSSVPWYITGGAFGPEASVVTSAVLALGCVAILFWRKSPDFGVETPPVVTDETPSGDTPSPPAAPVEAETKPTGPQG